MFILMALAMISAMQDASAATVTVDTAPRYDVARISGRAVYLHQADGIREAPSGNITIFEQSDGYVVVDTGISQAAGREIADVIEAMPGDKPVTAIVITHWHNDHALGIPGLLERWPDALVISSSNTRAHMAEQLTPIVPLEYSDEHYAGYVEAMGRVIESIAERQADTSLAQEVRDGYGTTVADATRIAAEYRGQSLALPELTMTDTLTLHDAEYPLELKILGRANTDGDLVVWSPSDGVIASGDIVVAPMPYGIGSYPTEWLTVLDRLHALDFQQLVPGHGEVQAGTEYVENLRTLITATRDRVTALLDQGLEQEAVIEQLDMSDFEAQFAGTNPFHQLMFNRYWVRPMVRSIIAARTRAAEGE